MRWLLVSLLVVCSSAFAQEGEQRAEAAGQSLIGSPAPRMVLKTIDGETVDLGKLYGKKAVYLKFWATWCVPCREQMPHFEKAFESRGPDLEVIAVNAGFNDSVEDVREYRKRLGIRMPIVIDDGTLGAALNLRVTPQHVVIGRDGRVLYVGHLANEQLDAALIAARGASGSAALASAVKGSAHAVGDPALSGSAEQTSAVKGSGGGMSASRAGSAEPAVGAKGAGHAVGVGALAPVFSASALDGRKLGSNGPVVLVFLSPWCESYLETSRAAISARCRDVRMQVEELAKQHPDTHWLGIASGIWASPEDLSKYVTKYKVTIPVTLDESGALFNSFHVRNVPTVVAINGHGVIEQRIEGSDTGLATQLSRVASVR
jgi:thiol-disulfide isomerase/thioredoxin